MTDLKDALERARGGGPARHHEKSEQQGKLPVRERVERLIDPGSFTEDGLLANWEQEGFGADGVVTGMATVAGRPVCADGQRPHGQGRARGARRRSRRSSASRSRRSSTACR